MEYYDNYTSLYGSGGGAAADFMLPHPPSSHPPLSTAHQFGILGHFPYQSTGSWDHSPLGFPNYKPTGDDILDAKALAASKNHSEAERRRRHRINTHLSNLRSLLPSTTKTDKASLLAEVIQHVKDLKRQTSHLIADDDGLIPAEEDHLTVDADSLDDEGNLVIKASLCCQDRHDLLPDLIATLNSLRLRTLKAEITTLAGRVKHLLFFTADHPTNDYSSSSNNNNNSDEEEDEDRDEYQPRIQQQYSISSIHEALKAVMEKGGGSGGHSSSGGSVKRQRTNRNINNI